MPSYKDELQAAIIISSRPHAEILDIDISEAAEVEGFVCAKDIPEGGSNMTGVVGVADEEVFADNKVVLVLCNRYLTIVSGDMYRTTDWISSC